MEGELELTALNHGRVEDLLHQPRHLLGSGLHDRSQLALLDGSRRHSQQAGGTYHSVQLVSQLVSEIREQLGIESERLRSDHWASGCHVLVLCHGINAADSSVAGGRAC